MTGDSYRRIHSRLREVRGDPALHSCANPLCDRLAQEWGLVGEPTRVEPQMGRDQRRWSDDLAAYAPLCHRCNIQMDRGGTWERCPNGHARAVAGVNSNGQCRQCNREHSREYQRQLRIRKASA